MSDLSDQIEKLVMDALSDAVPGPVIGFVGMVTYLDPDGDQSYAFFNTPDANLGESIGLARSVDLFYETQFRQMIGPDPDD